MCRVWDGMLVVVSHLSALCEQVSVLTACSIGASQAGLGLHLIVGGCVLHIVLHVPSHRGNVSAPGARRARARHLL